MSKSPAIQNYIEDITERRRKAIISDAIENYSDIDEFKNKFELYKQLEKRIDVNAEFIKALKYNILINYFLKKLSELRNTLHRTLLERPTSAFRNILNIDDSQSVKKHNRLTHYIQEFSNPQHTIKSRNSDRILLDVTGAVDSDEISGIHRITNQLLKICIEDYLAIPVYLDGDELYTVDNVSFAKSVVTPNENDKLILPGAPWNYPNLRKVREKFQRAGAYTIIVLHDLIPLLYPEFCDPYFTKIFQGWLLEDLLSADRIICVSKSTFVDLRNYIVSENISLDKAIPSGWCHWGADFSQNISEPSRTVQGIIELEAPILLTVSTIEPRKGYQVSLDAVDQLWSEGHHFIYCIVGKYGWNAEDVRRRINHHPELGRRLFWLDNVDDSDLMHLYQNAHASIFPSIAEGFGLMIVESAYYGVPIIASDISVFHEIGKESAIYFEVANSNSLAEEVKLILLNQKASSNIEAMTWRQATHNMMNLVRKERYQFLLGNMK